MPFSQSEAAVKALDVTTMWWHHITYSNIRNSLLTSTERILYFMFALPYLFYLTLITYKTIASCHIPFLIVFSKLLSEWSVLMNRIMSYLAEARVHNLGPKWYHPGGGEGGVGGTSYVGQYGMLGYTWVIFEKFSVLFPRDGFLFLTKFLYFFLQGGYLFWRKFLYLSNKMEPICKKFSVFHSTKLLHFTHKILFLYISTRWVSFQEIYCSGWNQLKRSCRLSQTLLIDLNNHLSRTGLFTDL